MPRDFPHPECNFRNHASLMPGCLSKHNASSKTSSTRTSSTRTAAAAAIVSELHRKNQKQNAIWNQPPSKSTGHKTRSKRKRVASKTAQIENILCPQGLLKLKSTLNVILNQVGRRSTNSHAQPECDKKNIKAMPTGTTSRKTFSWWGSGFHIRMLNKNLGQQESARAMQLWQKVRDKSEHRST